MSSILDRCAELEAEQLERIARDAQLRGGEGHSDTELAGSALAIIFCLLIPLAAAMVWGVASCIVQ